MTESPAAGHTCVYRKFREAAENFPADAMIVQRFIGEICDLERDADRPAAEIRDEIPNINVAEIDSDER